MIYHGFEVGECLPLPYWRSSGWLNEVRGEYYVTRLMRIDLDTLAVKLPLYVSVTEDSSCRTCLSDLIPVKDNKITKKYTFGACLHDSLYNFHKPQTVIEWIEVHLLLGAEIINIYLQDDLVDVYNAIEPYVKEGLVEVIDWRLKEPIIKGYTRANGQRGVINECLYKNLYSVKYMSFCDVDEYIIPQSDMMTWHDMFKKMRELINLDEYASYTFYNAYFMNNDKSLKLPEAKLLDTMCSKVSAPLFIERTTRIAHPEHAWHNVPKNIFQLWAVESGNVHMVEMMRKEYKRQYKVPIDVGLSHHYRPYIPQKFVQNLGLLHNVTVMSKYAQAVLLNIDKRICKV